MAVSDRDGSYPVQAFTAVLSDCVDPWLKCLACCASGAMCISLHRSPRTLPAPGVGGIDEVRALDISVVEELASPLSQPSLGVEVTAPSWIEARGSLDTLATDRALSA